MSENPVFLRQSLPVINYNQNKPHFSELPWFTIFTSTTTSIKKTFESKLFQHKQVTPPSPANLFSCRNMKTCRNMWNIILLLPFKFWWFKHNYWWNQTWLCLSLAKRLLLFIVTKWLKKELIDAAQRIKETEITSGTFHLQEHIV